MGVEIEKKYLITKMPDNLNQYKYHIIEQAYLTTNPVIRVRQEDDSYYMTYKGKGENDTALCHSEYNLPLTREAYDTLKSKAEGNIITKKRILIPYNNLTIELDIFEPPFKPLTFAEVEFDSLEDANSFVPPEWFGEEVTGQPDYTNAVLSRKKF